MTPIDRDWLAKVVAQQGMVIAEKTRTVVEDLALEYMVTDHILHFRGYSLFRTGSGVYKENIPLTDSEIEQRIAKLTQPHTHRLLDKRAEVELWLQTNIVPFYHGPLGIDLMVDQSHNIYVAEMNLRHTMGMVAHAENNK
ncbi:MAG: hypothetical protein IJ789_04865 [Bacteroidales bacterium]|nr:hypothetical protein [Bacteroidales bacterium]